MSDSNESRVASPGERTVSEPNEATYTGGPFRVASERDPETREVRSRIESVVSAASVPALPCRNCGASEAVHEPMLGTCPSLDGGVYDAVDSPSASVPRGSEPSEAPNNPTANRLATEAPRATGSDGRAGNPSAEHGVSPSIAPTASEPVDLFAEFEWLMSENYARGAGDAFAGGVTYRQRYANFVAALRSSRQTAETARRSRDEMARAHSASFGALVDISLLTDLDGEVDEYSNVVAAVQRMAESLAASRQREEEAREALKPFAFFAEQRAKVPMRGVDDTLYAIHTGTAFAAELRLSDCERAARVLAASVQREEMR